MSVHLTTRYMHYIKMVERTFRPSSLTFPFESNLNTTYLRWFDEREREEAAEHSRLCFPRCIASTSHGGLDRPPKIHNRLCEADGEVVFCGLWCHWCPFTLVSDALAAECECDSTLGCMLGASGYPLVLLRALSISDVMREPL